METNDSHGRFEASVNIFVDPAQKAQVIDPFQDSKVLRRFMMSKENLTLFLSFQLRA